MRTLGKRFLQDESGATAIEYGLIASLITIGIIAGASNIGKSIGTTLGQVSNNMSSTK